MDHIGKMSSFSDGVTDISLSQETVLVQNLQHKSSRFKYKPKGFPGGAVVENPPANAGDTGSSPGPGRSHMPRSN